MLFVRAVMGATAPVLALVVLACATPVRASGDPAMDRAAELVRRLPQSSVLVAFTPSGETLMDEVERLIPAGNLASVVVGDRTLAAWAALARKLGWEKRDATRRLMGGVAVLVVYRPSIASPELSWALFLEATPETARTIHAVLDAHPRQVVGRSPIFSVEEGAFLLSIGQLRPIVGANDGPNDGASAAAITGGRGRFVVLVPGDEPATERNANAPRFASADERIAAMLAVLEGDAGESLRSTSASLILRDASVHAGVLMRGDRVPVIPPAAPGGAVRRGTWDELGMISLSSHDGVLKVEAMAQSERFAAVLSGVPDLRADLLSDVEQRLGADAAQVSVRLPGDAQRIIAPPPMLPAMLPDLLPVSKEPIGHVSTRLVWLRSDGGDVPRVAFMGMAQSLGEAKRAVPVVDGQVASWVARLERGANGRTARDALAGVATLDPGVLREVAITVGTGVQGVRPGDAMLRYRPDHAGWCIVDLASVGVPKGDASQVRDTLRELGDIVAPGQAANTAPGAAPEVRRTLLRGFAGPSMVPQLLNGAMMADPSTAVIWRHLKRSQWEIWLDDGGRLRALVEMRFAEAQPGR